MRVSTLVRWTGLAALGLAAACSDVPTAPSRAASAVQADKGATAVVTLEGSAQFTVVPGQPVSLDYNRFKLDIPANALCELATSGYGRTAFDAPCALETAPQTFQVRWGTDDAGNIRISFDRDARFAPGKMASLLVRTLGELKSSGAILWYDAQAGTWVDEGTYDEAQRTKKSKGGTLMSRNLKHFSGYNIGAGVTDGDPTLDTIEAALTF